MERYRFQDSVGEYVPQLNVWLFDPDIYLLTLQEWN